METDRYDTRELYSRQNNHNITSLMDFNDDDELDFSEKSNGETIQPILTGRVNPSSHHLIHHMSIKNIENGDQEDNENDDENEEEEDNEEEDDDEEDDDEEGENGNTNENTNAEDDEDDEEEDEDDEDDNNNEITETMNIGEDSSEEEGELQELEEGEIEEGEIIESVQNINENDEDDDEDDDDEESMLDDTEEMSNQNIKKTNKKNGVSSASWLHSQNRSNSTSLTATNMNSSYIEDIGYTTTTDHTSHKSFHSTSSSIPYTNDININRYRSSIGKNF